MSLFRALLAVFRLRELRLCSAEVLGPLFFFAGADSALLGKEQETRVSSPVFLWAACPFVVASASSSSSFSCFFFVLFSPSSPFSLPFFGALVAVFFCVFLLC